MLEYVTYPGALAFSLSVWLSLFLDIIVRLLEEALVLILVMLQAMVTRFSSISTRKLSNALTILTYDKCMVATSDYNEFHKTVKKYIMTYLLGSNAQVLNYLFRSFDLKSAYRC